MKLENLTESYRERMQFLGMTQNELSKITGFSTTCISLILNGKSGSFQKLKEIEKALYEIEEIKKPELTYIERIEKLGKTQSFFARELGMSKQQFSEKIHRKNFERKGFEKLDLILEVYENDN